MAEAAPAPALSWAQARPVRGLPLAVLPHARGATPALHRRRGPLAPWPSWGGRGVVAYM